MSDHSSNARATAEPKRSLTWRPIDIVIVAILGVATGFIFVVWNNIGYAWFTAMDNLTPGLGGLAVGIWLLGGVLGGLIIRKPGAAIFVEVFAASVSAALGSQWGPETLYSGLAQGLGAELIFLIFAYRKFNIVVATLSGIGAGVGAWTLELFLSPNLAKSLEFNIIYLVCVAISGAILAGILGFSLMKSLAKTGALDRFAAGREHRV
ncbi:ECF transporter S component [Corynebacterium pseudodiphtheriticum]|uniref:ECF transporter S component n=1 Tax=Corynebacterium pseudodiphtheriticum TaxID=37637 RepID=UPI002542D272|nr:ECF transporter S component [Corynebacterium pseudodiphtheriticum]MDK4248876.1 ECF transporter S component [Corynebacterium pseudodiphtheriticum]MDK4287617.1 ECF transporter S component [Corynebacterium pseudodiphtheriticum]MDK8499443.1 ECF transporter S component [Corynebacterium pseudodiphtheriticum]MDK8583523.1 ECF transporter S component [Corynebacterium pseudodiphtheriticum]MDK8838667.1 ECF transporter S component [Corynebacterium pseudodiphtheriticum]